MKRLIQSITGGYVSSAKVVDGTLILSLPDAQSPVVWRMDLGHVKSSALEVRDNNDGTFSLILKTPREDVHNIAPFATRAQAVRALMAVSHALEQSHGHAAPPANDSGQPAAAPQASARPGSRWLTALVAVVLLLFMINLLARTGPAQKSLTGDFPGAQSSADGETNSMGTSQSADEFLMSR